MTLNRKLIQGILLSIIIIVVLFKVYASLIPEVQSAGADLNDTRQCVSQGFFFNETATVCQTSENDSSTQAFTSIPLSGIFSQGGIVILLLMIFLIILILKDVLKGQK